MMQPTRVHFYERSVYTTHSGALHPHFLLIYFFLQNVDKNFMTHLQIFICNPTLLNIGDEETY